MTLLCEATAAAEVTAEAAEEGEEDVKVRRHTDFSLAVSLATVSAGRSQSASLGDRTQQEAVPMKKSNR